MYFLKYIIFTIVILFNAKAFSLDVTVPVNIYQPLTKTYSKNIPGSTSIIINKNDLLDFKDSPIHEIINFLTGVKTRSIYGSNSSGSKTTIDIRGMGAQAKSNVLILINGQRLNNIDMSEIDFPSIPIESIDEIEVIKGNAASVLYGDGAIGGAINFITNPELENKNFNEVIYKSGTFNLREIIVNNSQNSEKYSLNTFFNHLETDGYRDENEQQQNNFTSEIRYVDDLSDHFISINYSEQIMSTPSDRSQDQLYTDRRGSDTPDDYINSEGGSLLYSINREIDDFTNFIINTSFRVKDSYSDLQSTNFPSYSDTSLTNYQITPRIDSIKNFFGKIFNQTYGVDIQYADYKSYRKESKNVIPLHVYDAWQTSLSTYSQNSINLNNNTILGLGLRFQKSKIGISDNLDTSAPDYGGWQTEHLKYFDQETNYAINIGLDKLVNKKTTIYGRVGNGFRFPNIDDRIGGSGGTSLDLSTQKSEDMELGLKYVTPKFTSNISTFIIDNINELTYDTDAFENINIDSTRRYGLELETNNKFFDKISFSNNFTFVKAKYTSGDQGTYATDFKGNDIPLVPTYSLDSILKWKISKSLKLISNIKYQDDMRMESDDENFQDTKISSHFIANLSLNSKFGKYFGNISINNIFNEKYHNYAVASSSTVGTYNAYPEPGREIILSLGMKF